MNILMATNTFTPHVGGVAGSVRRFMEEFRGSGHRVLVVAPEFPGAPRTEQDVVRVPAVQNFNGSDFAVPVPVTRRVSAALKAFLPQVVHSHHPFLLGDTALRVAASREVPVVFTHHTMYENYTHYVPGDSAPLKRFVIDLTTGYCNLCDAVIAPSETVADILTGRGVTVPIAVIPTGVDLKVFEGADGSAYRRAAGIPEDAFVVGHVGRLAPEKNVGFLAEAVAGFLARHPGARFLLIGEGSSKGEILTTFDRHGLSGRIHAGGVLHGNALAAAYSAMDVFAFASRTETQGMVLTEAMAAGVPVVALDAPGAREVVRDGENGRLVPDLDAEAFREALRWVAERDPGERRRLVEAAGTTAREFSMPRSAAKLLALYQTLIGTRREPREIDASSWTSARKLIGKEWEILRNIARAAGEAAVTGTDDPVS
ncbi:glycosyltransferase [bacterium]|nr:glycosyltransferase [bacterium]